jgi:hypothetical protein
VATHVPWVPTGRGFLLFRAGAIEAKFYYTHVSVLAVIMSVSTHTMRSVHRRLL